jgi:hypothetical protein
MISRENKVIIGFIALAVLLLAGVLGVSDPPTWVSSAVILGVGVIAPILVNEYLDRR